MMIRRLAYQLLAAGFLVLSVAGCKQDETSANPAPNSGAPGATAGTSDKKPLKLAFVTNGTSDFWTIAHKGVDKAVAEDPSLNVDFREIQQGTTGEQKEALDDLIVKGTQGIAISVRNPPNQVEMINAAAKRAMIFTQDSDAPGTDRACYVGTDNVAAGRQAGEEIKKACPGGGKIMFF
ncbi:MAG: substrate-binding domain-containing protein, partial [Fimbriimonadales bacterium]